MCGCALGRQNRLSKSCIGAGSGMLLCRLHLSSSRLTHTYGWSGGSRHSGNHHMADMVECTGVNQLAVGALSRAA